MEMKKGNCRSCGAPILWHRTNKGKWMPLDPDLQEASDLDAGSIIVTEEGACIRIKDGESYEDIEGYQSHFSTCPDADKHRRTA